MALARRFPVRPLYVVSHSSASSVLDEPPPRPRFRGEGSSNVCRVFGEIDVRFDT